MAVDLAAAAATPRPARAVNWRAATGLWLFVLAIAHGSLYAGLTPPWQAPDEIAHFEYAWLLGRLGRPLWNESASPELEKALIQSLYAYHAWEYVGLTAPAVPPERLANAPFFGLSRTLTRFSLSYVLYAAVGPAFGGAGLLAELYAMRAVSVLCGALVVVLTYALGRLVEPNTPALAWGSALFVVFLPQHTAITSAVSDGALAELLATLAVYGLTRLWRHGLSWPWLGVSLASSAGALLAKSTALFLAPLLAISLVYVFRQWYRAPHRTTRQRLAAVLGLLLGAIGLGAAGVALLSWLNRVSSQLVSVTLTLQETIGSAAWVDHLRRLVSDNVLAAALAQTLESFWAYFGWMIVRVPALWLIPLYGLAGLALLGWVRRQPAGQRAAYARYAPVGLAAGLAVLVLLAWFVLTPFGLGYSQGRYLYGAIAPLAVLLMAGWLSWRPSRDHGGLLLALAVVWMAFDAAALLNVLVPYFYRLG